MICALSRLARAAVLAMVVLPALCAAQTGMTWDGLKGSGRADPYGYSRDKAGTDDQAAKRCMQSAQAMPRSGNTVVDTRCSLVAFEVCMNKAIGTISQSQGAGKQCEIIKGIGGAGACAQPCAEAAALPTGGQGSVTTHGGSYSQLTPFAMACYNKVMSRPGSADPTSCERSEALECLMNGSASASVNAAILQERKSACEVLSFRHPKAVCLPCSQGRLRVDYDPSKIDLDSQHCTPELAAAKHCVR